MQWCSLKSTQYVHVKLKYSSAGITFLKHDSISPWVTELYKRWEILVWNTLVSVRLVTVQSPGWLAPFLCIPWASFCVTHRERVPEGAVILPVKKMEQFCAIRLMGMDTIWAEQFLNFIFTFLTLLVLDQGMYISGERQNYVKYLEAREMQRSNSS
jgi:hypothetical protein